MNEEIKNALEALASDVKGKTSEEVKSAIDALEAKYKEEMANEVKSVKEEFEAELKKVQDHADALDVKLQEKKKNEKKQGDAIVEAIKENFEDIKHAGETKSKVRVEVKDMTLGNALTGDQPRDYNFDVVKRPLPIANVSDLTTAVQISGGTYTYVRSTLASGAVATQTEGSDKAQLEYDYTMVDANTNFIAGFAVYSKKMRNNLPFLENTISMDLRKDYLDGENAAFQTILASEATASTEVITGQNKVEMLIAEVATLAGNNFMADNIVVRPSDYYDILITEKSIGAGYGLPGVVTFEGGVLRINGILVRMANWLPANKYYVGNWSRVRQPITEGFSLSFSEEDSDNFRKNNITARVEQQTTVTVEQPDALIYGDFTAV